MASLKIGDKANVRYKGAVFSTTITDITGSTLSLFDEKNNIRTSITWNGINWLLPGNIPAERVDFSAVTISPITNPVTSISSIAATTTTSSPKRDPFTLPEIPLVKVQIYTPTTINTMQITIPEFPYKRKFLTEKDIRQKFQNLSNYNFRIVEMPYIIKRMPNVNKRLLSFNGKSLVIDTPIENYDLYDNISDVFNEEQRMNCKRNDQTETPLQFWRTHQNEVKQKAKELGGINEKNLREAMYALHYECTTFKPSLIVGFIKYLGSKRILDISSGWGDRLIGAMAMNNQIQYYVGVDPNSALFPGYQKIIEFFIPNIEDRKKYILIEGEFEKVTLPDLTYDLVFSSPPFFDLEEYAEKNQSYIGRTAEQWYNDFLIASLKKAWSRLEKNGFMVLYINDTKDYAYTERMVNDISKFENSQYIGCLPVSDLKEGKNMNPFWIVRKL